MTTAALRYNAVTYHTSSSSRGIKIRWKLAYVVVALLSFIMLIFYVYQINKLTQGAYLVKNYNREIATLSKENQSLEANFAQTSFLGMAEERAQELNFQKTSNVTYVQMLQSSLAEAK